MLFETQIASPVTSPYQQHQYLEALFADLEQSQVREARIMMGESPPRDYLWCDADGTLMIRRSIPTNDLSWEPVIVPPAKSVINFQLAARCRRSVSSLPRDQRHMFKRGARPPIIDPIQNLGWLRKHAGRIGLLIEDAEVEMSIRLIEKAHISRRGVQTSFSLAVSNFFGFATVIDTLKFERALTMGVGDSKAFGLGYIIFWQRGQ